MKTLIRVCNWERRSGKTWFVINDSKRLLEEYNKPKLDNKVLIFSPDRSHSKDLEHYYSQLHIGAYNAAINKRLFIHPSYVLKDSTTFRGIDLSGNLYIYFDDVNFMGLSFEELMIKCSKLSTGTLKMMTFIGTEKEVPTIFQRASQMVRDDNEVAETYGR